MSFVTNIIRIQIHTQSCIEYAQQINRTCVHSQIHVNQRETLSFVAFADFFFYLSCIIFEIENSVRTFYNFNVEYSDDCEKTEY